MAGLYVFISYSRQDREFVDRLVAELRDNGINTWTDLDNILPGQAWEREITHGVLNASALIYVSSRNSIDSPWIHREIEYAAGRDAPVIPVVLDDDGERHIPHELRQFQWVDFRRGFEPAFDALLSGILQLQHHAPLAPTEAKSKGYMFISYADEDGDFVRGLTGFMKEKGYGYWDFRESERDYQSDYTLELERVIKQAHGMLSVVSPDWKRSPTAFKELRFSERVGTPVFLLMVKDPGPTLLIEGLTFIDFTGLPERGFGVLDREMRRKGL